MTDPGAVDVPPTGSCRNAGGRAVEPSGSERRPRRSTCPSASTAPQPAAHPKTPPHTRGRSPRAPGILHRLPRSAVSAASGTVSVPVPAAAPGATAEAAGVTATRGRSPQAPVATHRQPGSAVSAGSGTVSVPVSAAAPTATAEVDGLTAVQGAVTAGARCHPSPAGVGRLRRIGDGVGVGHRGDARRPGRGRRCHRGTGCGHRRPPLSSIAWRGSAASAGSGRSRRRSRRPRSTPRPRPPGLLRKRGRAPRVLGVMHHLPGSAVSAGSGTVSVPVSAAAPTATAEADGLTAV